MNIRDLIPMLEKAKVANRDLDLHLWCIQKNDGSYWDEATQQLWVPGHHDGPRFVGTTGWSIVPYTASLDAALTLVPKGKYWIVAAGKMHEAEPLYGVQVREPFYDGREIIIGESEHPTSGPIALCIAALLARETSAKGESGEL